MNAYTEIVQQLEKHYLVPDILLPTSTCLFILESPHVQELKFKAPVSGNSGATMSKHIFGQAYARFPLGRLVKKNVDNRSDRPSLNGIGLLNVSNIPLQKLAYGQMPATAPDISEWFDAMSTVRTNHHTEKYNSELAQQIQEYLITTLQRKLLKFQGRSITLVPCGRFAQKFIRLANVHDDSWDVIENVPHPSYNSWDRAQYAKTIKQVVDAVKQAAKPLSSEF